MTKKKTGCMIFSIGDEYRKIAECATASFKKHHPDITLHYVDETNVDNFISSKHVGEEVRNHHGIFRFAIAAEIMTTNNYDKFIVLGADTITCARMDEFLDDDHNDMLLTSCYPYQLTLPYGVDVSPSKKFDIKDWDFIRTPALCFVVNGEGEVVGEEYYFGNIYQFDKFANWYKEKSGLNVVSADYMYANPDVSCFNSAEALRDVYKYTMKHWDDYHKVNDHGREIVEKVGIDFYADQGGLNIVSILSIAQSRNVNLPLFSKYSDPKRQLPAYKVKYVDIPYSSTTRVYNVRGKKSLSECGANNMKIHPSAHPACGNEDGASISDYYVADKKLYTVDGKQVKVWHYLAHFGLHTEIQDLGRVNKIVEIDFEKPSESLLLAAKKRFCDMVNSYVLGIFNEETKKFFKEECDCGDFFEKEFTLK